MFPQLPERCRNKSVLAAHAVFVNSDQDLSGLQLVQWWSKRPEGMSSDIDILMEKYEAMQAGVHLDNDQYAEFINAQLELVEAAHAEWNK